MTERLIEWLMNYPSGLALALVVLILLLCGIGLPLPEEIPIIVVGYLVYEEDVGLVVGILTTVFAIVAGDCIIYYLGWHYGNRIFEFGPLKVLVTPERMSKANHYFHRFGNRVVFVSRFIAGVRATVFLTAGILKMPFRRFLLMDGLAAGISIPMNILVVRYLLNLFGEELDLALVEFRKIGRSLVLLVVLAVVLISIGIFLRRYFLARKLPPTL